MGCLQNLQKKEFFPLHMPQNNRKDKGDKRADALVDQLKEKFTRLASNKVIISGPLFSFKTFRRFAPEYHTPLKFFLTLRVEVSYTLKILLALFFFSFGQNYFFSITILSIIDDST